MLVIIYSPITEQCVCVCGWVLMRLHPSLRIYLKFMLDGERGIFFSAVATDQEVSATVNNPLHMIL